MNATLLVNIAVVVVGEPRLSKICNTVTMLVAEHLQFHLLNSYTYKRDRDRQQRRLFRLQRSGIF